MESKKKRKVIQRRRSPGEGNGSLLQCSCLENPMDGGAWGATGHGIEKSQTQLNNFTSLHFNTN